MSFLTLIGNPKSADAHLLSTDGQVIPFHKIIFQIIPDDRKLDICKFEEYIDSQCKDSKTPIALPFDSQTVWRILCFIYSGTYQDEDKDMTFPEVLLSDSADPSNRLSDTPPEHQEVQLVRGLYNLHLTSLSFKSGILLKALGSVKVFGAACMFNIDRLVVEAAHRFGELITGAFDQPDFPQLIAPVFNSVVDPQCMLYSHLVQECFAHCQDLVDNPKFITALEHNGKLAVHLYRRLAELQASLGIGNASSVPDAGGSASVVDSSAVTLLQSQLDSALAAVVSTKQEQIDGLEQELADVQITCTEALDAASAKQEQIDALKQEFAHLKDNVPRKTTSIDLEAHIQKLMVEKSNKDAVIDNLEHQLEEKERKLAESDHALSNANKLKNQLAGQINAKRNGQSDSTNFLLEHNEARETVEKLQARHTVFEDKIRDLEAQLAAHAQQPIIVNTASVPQLSGVDTAHPSQGAGHRRVNSFGAMANSVNTIVAASSGVPTRTPTRPHSPLPTPPIPVAQTLVDHELVAGGAETFVARMDRLRREAAGIHGGEAKSTSPVGAPASMPLHTRGVFTFRQQPARSASPAASMASVRSPVNGVSPGPHAAPARRAVGPYSPQANGGAHASSTTPGVADRPRANGLTPRTNGSAAIPIVNPARHAPVAHQVAPVIPAAPVVLAAPVIPAAPVVPAAPVTPVAPVVPAAPAAAANGQGNGTPDPRDRIIERLTADVSFLRGQLNDARAGPSSNIHTRGPGGHGSPNPRAAGDSVRLQKVLRALNDYDVDHRSCNDCGINFNAQWRGLVDNTDDRHLILKCGKCGEEKCRFPC